MPGKDGFEPHNVGNILPKAEIEDRVKGEEDVLTLLSERMNPMDALEVLLSAAYTCAMMCNVPERADDPTLYHPDDADHAGISDLMHEVIEAIRESYEGPMLAEQSDDILASVKAAFPGANVKVISLGRNETRDMKSGDIVRLIEDVILAESHDPNSPPTCEHEECHEEYAAEMEKRKANAS